MSYQSAVVDVADTAQEAARQMRDHVVSALPVVERGTLVGIVTARDLALRVVAVGAHPTATRVDAVMSRAPQTCQAGESLESAGNRMEARCVPRLIVVDQAGAVCGTISVSDMVFIDEARPLALAILKRIAVRRGELDATFGTQP